MNFPCGVCYHSPFEPCQNLYKTFLFPLDTENHWIFWIKGPGERVVYNAAQVFCTTFYYFPPMVLLKRNDYMCYSQNG